MVTLRSLGFVCALLVPTVALAETPSAVPIAGPASSTPAAAAPAAAPAAAVGPKSEATGYGYGDAKGAATTRSASPRRRLPKAPPNVPVAVLSGFEMPAEGGSRLFVQLSQNLVVEEHRADGKITYVLKGARVVHTNNLNALVTLHFNTPVARARLVPRGRDLEFIVELRAPVGPTYKVEALPEGAAGVRLVVDFPAGEFLNPAAPN